LKVSIGISGRNASEYAFLTEQDKRGFRAEKNNWLSTLRLGVIFTLEGYLITAHSYAPLLGRPGLKQAESPKGLHYRKLLGHLAPGRHAGWRLIG